MVHLQTLYRSDDLWVINKPVRTHYDELVTQSVSSDGSEGWEPVHRLDFETSGALLFARGNHIARLRELFKNPHKDQIQKIYLAGASASLGPSFSKLQSVEGFVASRYRHSKKVRFLVAADKSQGWRTLQPARHEVIERALPADRELAPGFQGVLYEVRLHTGHRHQIRAFFASMKAPLVGDPLYEADAPVPAATRLELHAWQLHLRDPQNMDRWLHIKAPL